MKLVMTASASRRMNTRHSGSGWRSGESTGKDGLNRKGSGKTNMNANLTAGPGMREGQLRPYPGASPPQTIREGAARMLVAEASEQIQDRQVFRLSAHHGSRATFPPAFCWQWSITPENLTDHGGGPATDSHRLPYSPGSTFASPRKIEPGTCRTCIKVDTQPSCRQASFDRVFSPNKA